MHHRATKSNLVDSDLETNQHGFKDNNGLPLCPKPRRLEPAIPSFLAPLICAHHIHSQSSGDSRSEILNIIEGKNVEGRDCLSSGCYPSCYSGSPPGRTENPLVHDMYFLHQMEIHSPFSRTNLSDKFNLTSASPT
ncbi:uncharacterized protein LOC116404717 [Cucumis sativus]|uniref:Uncharacterized protein n=1 Tax=Cucumis sativus TaxID=3659 RepID=A0A0A0KHD1_CUCSA|nr:uncharacterized protein LOC116404717 [Cucumis sativus]KGN48953.1 hypothetical protein Csa_003840 [Cucumis sativus]